MPGPPRERHTHAPSSDSTCELRAAHPELPRPPGSYLQCWLQRGAGGRAGQWTGSRRWEARTHTQTNMTRERGAIARSAAPPARAPAHIHHPTPHQRVRHRAPATPPHPRTHPEPIAAVTLYSSKPAPAHMARRDGPFARAGRPRTPTGPWTARARVGRGGQCVGIACAVSVPRPMGCVGARVCVRAWPLNLLPLPCMRAGRAPCLVHARRSRA